jgi:hypothetical protein
MKLADLALLTGKSVDELKAELDKTECFVIDLNK